ncbi:alpha-L-rhamnosidase [Pedobacter psychroterrae]|uniref:alpha-L-rhamnosidase n=1 Tax=Pedobacter psychroterrae TaxID=2530453 RepID=A0A4R0NR72_9SPHI|nr:alpha-L-rhamnosidase [Pedobacter psychroterrae]TCD01574.1 alpha-L-rhamnosidase [Pedobacter psychroterrae]
MRFRYKSILVLCLSIISFDLFASLQPVNLTVEYKKNPLGIEAARPRLGWWIDTDRSDVRQGAYQIQVSPSKQGLLNGKSVLWNSGRRNTDRNISVLYDGPALKSAQKYYWRVRVWNTKGKASNWSEVAGFATGILTQQEWAKASWISNEVLPDSLKVIPGIHGSGDGLGNKLLKRAVNPYFKKSFQLKKSIAQASVFVSGMGQHELYLNGKKVSADFLTPGWTNYEKRCLYNTYDVTNQLQQGENVLGSIVGGGFFYINRERYRKVVSGYGYPMFRLILQIRFTDGTSTRVVTDESWKTMASPVVYSSIYGGEDYDARLEQKGWNQKSFNDASWKNAIVAKGPDGKMAAQIEYPVRVMDTIPVKKISVPEAGKSIYDFGQNASGIVSIKLSGKRGDKIKITPSELLTDKGFITQKSSGENFYFEYTLKGEGVEEWTPKFTYYGFRYAMIEGVKPTSVELLHTRNSAPGAGSFSSSNELFNKIYHLIDWSLRSNIVSVSTDCPHREKLGWLEQAHLMGESVKFNYDVFHLYNKIVDDMIEAQLPDGMMPSIAPEFVQFDGPFRDDPGYGSAAVILPWYLYKWYGDTDVLQKSYPMMKKYVSYLQRKSVSNVITYGLGDWLDIGPNSPGVSQLTPIALTATAFYYQDVMLLAKMARTLGNKEDTKVYDLLAADIKKAFNAKFFDKNTCVYGSGSQTSYSMPLYLGLVEDGADREKVFENLKDSILVHDKRITAGDIGHRFLVQALAQEGASDLLYQMNNRTDVPGYGYQIKNGATALAEHWSGPTADFLSQNHMIFGHLMEWFYSGLAGIRQQEDDSGYRNFIIDPKFQGIDMDWVKSSYQSVNGIISVSWKKSGSKFTMKVTIPANSSAEVFLKVSSVDEVTINGLKFLAAKEIKQVRKQDGKLILTVPSGTYEFECN